MGQKMRSNISEEAVRIVAKPLEANMNVEKMRAAINVLAAAGTAAVPAAPALASVMSSNVTHSSSLKRTASAILTDIATNISTVASLDLNHTVQSLAYAVSQPTSSHAD